MKDIKSIMAFYTRHKTDSLGVVESLSGREMIDCRSFVIQMRGLCLGEGVDDQPNLKRPAHPSRYRHRLRQLASGLN